VARVIWVVGAGSGVGEACCRQLASPDVCLVLSGRNLASLERVAGDLGMPGERLMLVAGDMATDAAAADAAKEINARFGSIDTLINCAGANVVERNLGQLTVTSVSDVLRGNLQVAFLLTLAVLPTMRANRFGTIVHVASWSARHYAPKSGAAYSAAKQGVVALCHSINMEENANGIRACAICPSEINTRFLELRPEPPGKLERQKMIQPADVAELVLFVVRQRPGICVNELVLSYTAPNS
jgi:NADP-dependent 3-hydroxy acid dehydrogenase YdfG